MPNLRAICRQVLQLAPDPYLRRTIVDDGSQGGVHGPVAVCQDILLATAVPDPDDLAFANFPAPGTALRCTASAFLTDATTPARPSRASICGCATAAGVMAPKSRRVFASLATLITPERWAPVGEVNTGDGRRLAQGGDVAGLAGDRPDGCLALRSAAVEYVVERIAAAELPGSPPGKRCGPFGCNALPPGPPYFDWKVFRDFLRSRRVAWRNIHAARPDPNALSLALPFLIAGTPDQARHFDFEVVARLPHDARVELEVPEAFAAKLRQNESWIGSLGAVLALPQRPRVRFSNVKVAPDALVAATFRVKWPSSGGPPRPGQSLALRQLWRGEEVGRVTFYFVDTFVE